MNEQLVKQGVNNQAGIYIVVGVVGLGAIALAYFGVIKPILNKLGVTDSADKKYVIEDEYFSSLLYRNNKSRTGITKNEADYSASMIYDAKGVFLDAEDMAVGGIRKAKSLVDVSFISNQFSELYGKDLITYLDSFLEEENYTNIKNYIKTLKKY